MNKALKGFIYFVTLVLMFEVSLFVACVGIELWAAWTSLTMASYFLALYNKR